MCAIVGAERLLLSFSTEAEFQEIANKDTGRFRKLGQRRTKSTEENEKGEGRTCTEEGAIFWRGQIAPQLLFCGGRKTPFTVAEAIAQNNKVLCNLVRQGCAGMGEG